jgi:uncharacterized protein YaeQ
MATTTTIYRFQIELSDIKRAVYENLDFRVAKHPSEHMPYLMSRVLAYILNTQEGLVFSATGLHDPDTAAISIPDSLGGFKLIIEIGSPSARKLHKATKVSKDVKVYTYKTPERFMNELREEKIHRVNEIEFYSFSSEFLEQLSLVIKRDNRWGVLFDDGTLTIQVGDQSISGELGVHRYN